MMTVCVVLAVNKVKCSVCALAEETGVRETVGGAIPRVEDKMVVSLLDYTRTTLPIAGSPTSPTTALSISNLEVRTVSTKTTCELSRIINYSPFNRRRLLVVSITPSSSGAAMT